jgi:DNA polymerase-3 subunit alpha
MERAFVHLQVHSEFSFLQAPIKIPALLAKAEKLGQNAIALTDHGFMFGILDFYMFGREDDEPAVKRILGSHIYIQTDRANSNDKSSYNRLTLLAENQEGYKNLIKIVSEPYTTEEKYQEIPTVSLDFLLQNKEGLIAIAGDTASRFGRDVCGNMENKAKTFLDDLCKIFDKEHLYFCLQEHHIETETLVNDFLKKYAAENNRQLVVANNVHYLSKEDAITHKALVCMGQKKKLSEFDDEYFSSEEFYLKSAEEMYELFPNDIEALENTVRIAERCNVSIKTKNVGAEFWPRFDCPKGFASEYDYLRHLVFEKIPMRYPNGIGDEKIEARVETELATIKQKNVPGYFLIIQDFILWAKNEGISIGPGRGSAAGSIVAYILGITDLDPLQYALLFERFLNPERPEMPDIDIDVSDRDRDKLIKYITEKYGKENVTQLITYGGLKPKAVLRAVGRLLDWSISDVDWYAKKIPNKLPVLNNIKDSDKINLKNVRAQDEELELKIESSNTDREFWDWAVKLEGFINHSGTHAAALIIAPCKMTELVPIYRLSAKDSPVAQYDMHYADKIGLLKMDILGLENLSIIQDTVKTIKKTRNYDLDIEHIPLNDAKTFELFGQGNTIGIFQFESPGMQRYLRELKPSHIEELINMNGLYRPGPMEHIPRYIRGKNDSSIINCYHDSLKPILMETYGVIVFQEHVMQIVQILSGFSLGKADTFRKAMGKKKEKEMAKMQPEFFDNGKARGYNEQLLKKIWEDLIPFCNYAFNKSHSATYAYVAYQTAYLKTNFSQEYMAAVMNSIDKIEKFPMFADECQRMGIEILPPDVNKSEAAFCVEKRALRWGLSQIKDCGAIVAKDIEDERKKNGKYKSLFDFVRRLHLLDKITINKRALEGLVKAGALDSMPGARSQKFASVEFALADAASWKIKKQSAQMSFFGDDTKEEPKLEESEEWSLLDSLLKEQKTLGVRLSAHPLNEYYAEIKGFADFELCDKAKINERMESVVKIGALVTAVNEKQTKNGDTIAILILQDRHDKIEAFCGAAKWKTFKEKIIEGALIIASGKLTISAFNNKPQLMLNSFEFLDKKMEQAKIFHIELRSNSLDKMLNSQIENYFKASDKEKGASLCFYVTGNKGSQYKMESNKYKIPSTRESLKKLVSIFGKNAVWVSTFVLLISFAFFTAACSPNRGTQFEAEMLGLTPGSTIASVGINWYSDEGEKSSVHIFDAAGSLIKTAEGISGVASNGKIYHKATLNNLTAGTKYKYAVSSDGNNWSNEYNYTVPTAGKFKFAAVADPQVTTGAQDEASKYFSSPATTAKGWEEIVEKIAKVGANFIISAGDQVDTFTGNEDEYAILFAPAWLRNIPFAPTVGNHDAHCLFMYHYNLPNEQNPPAISTCSGSGDGSDVERAGNYYFRYNNVLFIVLNTSAYPKSKEEAQLYITAFNNAITSAKNANAEYDWIIVVHHKSTASLAIHAADSDIQYYVEAGFENLMTKHGINLVLAGHDHIYARSNLMKQKNTDYHSVVSDDGEGTIYLTLSTASGLKYYDEFNASNGNAQYPYLLNGKTGSSNLNAENIPLSLKKYAQAKTPEYTIVEVNGKNMAITTYSINGTEIDSFTISTTFRGD